MRKAQPLEVVLCFRAIICREGEIVLGRNSRAKGQNVPGKRCNMYHVLKGRKKAF